MTENIKKMIDQSKEYCKSLPLELGELSINDPYHVSGYYNIVDENNCIIDGIIYANIYEKVLIRYTDDGDREKRKLLPLDAQRYKLIQNINFRILRQFQEIGYEPDGEKEGLSILYNKFLEHKKRLENINHSLKNSKINDLLKKISK